MHTTTTAASAVELKVWVQTEGRDVMCLLYEPHTTIIEDLKRTVFGNNRDKYQAFLLQQYLRPDTLVPADTSAAEPIKFKFIVQHPNTETNNDADDIADAGIIMDPPDESRSRTMSSNRQVVSKFNKFMNSNPLWSVFDKVIILLNDLRSKKYILSWQLDKMMPKRETVQLAYLYFIPKPHKAGTPLRPIVSSMNMPTTGISKFLDKLIRPIFDKHARSTTIIDGVDLIHRLEAYTTNGHLIPKTYLCTFDITDLYTMLPQEESLDILIEFLLQYGYQKVQNIPIDIIRKLALIVIKENVFVYEKKFYRQVIGGAMGSAFTLTLANIFMWKWEKQLVHRLKVSNEIYGRYVDAIFFTSNDSLEFID
ncbi:unnamed protein product [Rotaria socialis]